MAEYIDRSLLGIGKAKEEVFEHPDYARGWNAAISIIESAPIADVAPVRHGLWKWDTENIYNCTFCGQRCHVDEIMGQPKFCYCPNCGAKMDLEKGT